VITATYDHGMRWDPFTALARLDEEFDSVVRHTFGAVAEPFMPAVEMVTDGADVVITLELPGVAPADVSVEVGGRRLTVSGERRDRAEGRRGETLVREVRYGAFRRTFQLPVGVRAEQVTAEADNGLLRLRIRDIAKPVPAPARIPVRGAGTGPAAPRVIEAS
jgi:HSP20 family protein